MLLRETPLTHLFRGQRDEAKEHIIKQYTRQWSAVVNFLYFANVMRGRLIESKTQSRQADYAQALQESDFLLPDGIALQVLYRWTALGRKHKIWLANLNGTDFIPYLLQELLVQFPDIHVGLYSSFDPSIGKGEERLEKGKKRFEEVYHRSIDFARHNDYKKSNIDEFPWEDYLSSCATRSQRVLLVCKGTPHQELRVWRHRKRFAEAGVLVINAGWWIDYLSGFERRAPRRVVKARVLETFWRVATQPQKNAKKFLVMFGVIRWGRKQLMQRFFSRK